MSGSADVVIAVVVVVLALLALAGGVALRRRGGGRGAAPTVRAPQRPPAAPRPKEPVTEQPVPSAAVVPRGKGLADRVRGLFPGGNATHQTWEGLEDALIKADVGPGAATEIVRRVRSGYRPPMDPAEAVVDAVTALFDGDSHWSAPQGKPAVLMVVGVNGTGKTTTIGKLANRLAKGGRSVGMAASDTYRAAAGEQLESWARRTGAHLVSQERGADPGAVAFDAVKSAQSRGIDVLIVDTAGRLHTRAPLMEELRKVRRVLEKAAGRPPDDVLLVLDATTGQNGIAQARAFTEAVEVSGVVLTKMDGTARGGIVCAVRQELGIPIVLVGSGEGPDDLAPFEPEAFARRLIS